MVAPALEPVEYRVVADLESTLAAISTSSIVADFYTNVKTVIPMDRSPAENLPMPCVVVHHTGTEHDWGPIGLYQTVVNVDLYLVIPRTDSATTWRRDLYRFAADVRRAVMIDAHRGSVSGQANAFDTHVVRTEIGGETEGKNTAMARLAIQFQFRDSIDDLTQSA